MGESDKYECFGCGEVFEDRKALRRHRREHHRELQIIGAIMYQPRL